MSDGIKVLSFSVHLSFSLDVKRWDRGVNMKVGESSNLPVAS